MKRDREIYRKIGWAGLLVLAVLLLGACTDEDEAGRRNVRRFHLVLGSPSFPEVSTRALPENYVTYGALYGASLPEHAQIQTYIASKGTAQPIVGVFTPNDVSAGDPPETTRSWSSNFQVDQNGKYYVYGFLPKEDMNNVNIAPYNTDYENGAVLTINGLQPLTQSDLCVIVGVKGNTDNTTPIASLDMASRMGQFDVVIDKDDNYAYMLVDHIFCWLDFDIKVSNTYRQLRTIKIKSIKLTSYNSLNQPLKTVNATVTLAANNVQRNPLLVDGTVRSVYVNINETGEMQTPAMLYDYTNDSANPDGRELTTDAYSLVNYYAPAAAQIFELETHYDVYDRYGNLVRENQTAMNRFQPASMTSGFKYTYHITVGPTYLYSLSEKDLDNPPITIVASN